MRSTATYLHEINEIRSISHWSLRTRYLGLGKKEGKCKKDILTNCPSSIPMTQARNARGRTSSRRLAGTAAIVFLKMDGREKTFQTYIRVVLPVA